ncbi:MAG: cysteine-rich small domain-containing protein [Firmicutes bacterium]|nr:cysteine-rich small domain-containing protein [Bacillota bacterium]
MEELDRLSGYYTIVIVKNIVSKEKQYKFFQHRNCEFFPCHKMENVSDFNCLFCFCPFYSLGESCGGNFTYSQKGIKSCVNCTYPHDKKNYSEIMNRLKK